MSADLVSPGFVSWAIEALIASTLLMAVVLLVRKGARQALGAQLAYWLWALPALRMAMPPLPASWRESAAAPISAASETVMVLVEPMMPAAAATDGAPFPWVALVAGAWVLGGLAFFVWHGLAHLHYVRKIVAPPARHERLPDGTTLVESDEAIGPVAFGVLRRFVAVPTDFAERYDADERKLALAHELGHHARGDLIANWIALAMLACHWFNPIAWMAYRKFRSDQEMANDARVLSALPPIERHAYACAIVKAAHGRAVTAACHLHTIEDLKGRLRMLKASKKSRKVLMAGGVGIASLTIAGLGLTASGAAAEKIRTAAETQVERVAQAVAPTPPAPPAVAVDEWGDPVRADAARPERRTRIVVTRDGKTNVYEGAAADQYLAANPDSGARAPREVRRHRIVIRGKDGKVRTYEGAEADAYLRDHPEMTPPVPPVPPVPPRIGVGPGRDNLAYAEAARSQARASAAYARAAVAAAPAVVNSRSCSNANSSEFVRNDTRGGRTRIIVCHNRIERFAANQTREGLRGGLAGLEAGRAAILSAPMPEDARREALADIERSRADMRAEMARAAAAQEAAVARTDEHE